MKKASSDIPNNVGIAVKTLQQRNRVMMPPVRLRGADMRPACLYQPLLGNNAGHAVVDPVGEL